MTQPPGFIDHSQPSHVCRLHKAIYSLKQAPCAWYTELKQFLISFGFHNSKSNASLFIYNTTDVTIYFLVYVKDLLVTGNYPSFIAHFIRALSTKILSQRHGCTSLFSWCGGTFDQHKPVSHST